MKGSPKTMSKIMKVLNLSECEVGTIVQFLNKNNDGKKLKSGDNISEHEYRKLSYGHCKGIVIAHSKTKTKVLEFENDFNTNDFQKGLFILSSMDTNYFKCIKLKIKGDLEFIPYG